MAAARSHCDPQTNMLHFYVNLLEQTSDLPPCRVGSAKDVVQKGQSVWVKVVSVVASKVSLSMRDVNQETGEDLLPAPQGGPGSSSNPAPAGHSLRGLSGITVKDDDSSNQPKRRLGKRMTSPERWEITQLIKSGVLDVRDYPTFDEEEGVCPLGHCLASRTSKHHCRALPIEHIHPLLASQP